VRRLRFYKIVLPAVLALFVFLLVRELKPLSAVHTPGTADSSQLRSKATGIRAVDMEGGRKKLEIDAGQFEEGEDGSILLEDIKELKVFRDDQMPLIIQAVSGHIAGARGERMMTFDREVILRDPEKQLVLRIPALVVDEAAGEARSTDQVTLEGDELSGQASRLVYGLIGQPSYLDDPELADGQGGTVRARRAILHDGLNDVELLDDVRLTRGQEHLSAQQLRVKRRPSDKLERIEASGEVQGGMDLGSGVLAELAGDTLDVRFDEAGQPYRAELTGAASVRRGGDSIRADQITAKRLESAQGGWRVVAEGSAEAQGVMAGEPGLLRASSLRARLDDALELIDAAAAGRVSFDATDTRAEAARGSYVAAGAGELRLIGTERRKARLARLRTRIAAEEISTDRLGSRLFAERQVEATLLPGNDASVEELGIFSTQDAIHFVSQTLESRDGGAHLIFRGAVRGWQGDRNLSAETIEVDERERSMSADQNVTARVPRGAARAATEDFIQITSDRLDYSDAEGLAVFRENVRVQIAEGWLEAQQVELELAAEGRNVEQIRASGDVRLEFREPVDEGSPERLQLVAGSCDRLVYHPSTETVWLIGENTPATVRRIGAGTGTTSGRVLRYDLEQGSLEVDSGDSGPARIRTSG